MKCPSCHYEQADDRLDCEACGLIFAKWLERHAPPVEAAPPESGNPVRNSTAAENPDPPPAAREVLLQEPGIPNRPDDVVLPYGQRPRLYEQIAALDFQRDMDGYWIYFPWGMFGKGYRLKDAGAKDEIEGFLARFCCVHSPLVAILGLAAIVTWFYNGQNPTQGLVFLGFYFPLAYLFLWITTNQWTAKLPVSGNKLNQQQYYFLFSRIFYWKTLLDLEVISLLFLLAWVWMWLSEKWRWFIPVDNISIMWMWFGFSGVLLALFSYLYYFRKKP